MTDNGVVTTNEQELSMPATHTTTRPLSPRQARFIASLAAERVVPETMGDAVRRADAGVLPIHAASELITTLLDAPRNDVAADAEVMVTPSDQTRAGRMLNAGGVEATVTLINGEHVTLQVRSRKPQGRGWTNCAPTDEGARITLRAFGNKVGWVNVVGGAWKVTLRSRNLAVRQAVHALFEYANNGQTAGAERVQESSRCGRCMRTLTDPVSIARGIGPECYGRGTGSRAARIEAGVDNGPTMAEANAEIARREAANDAAFAAREREQEEAAFASDPDFQVHLSADTRNAESALEMAADALSTPVEVDAGGTVLQGNHRVAAAVDLAAHAREDLSLSTLAADAASPVLTRDKQRARDLISEALDAYCSDEDRDFAMHTFDQLAAR
jgi:hypothetical protein